MEDTDYLVHFLLVLVEVRRSILRFLNIYMKLLGEVTCQHGVMSHQ